MNEGWKRVNLEYANLENLISEYGKAQQEFGKAGGWIKAGEVTIGQEGQGQFGLEGHGILVVPADEATHRIACERYGAVMDALERHFCKPRWRRIWDALFGI